jgi:hypothetical protein
MWMEGVAFCFQANRVSPSWTRLAVPPASRPTQSTGTLPRLIPESSSSDPGSVSIFRTSSIIPGLVFITSPVRYWSPRLIS